MIESGQNTQKFRYRLGREIHLLDGRFTSMHELKLELAIIDPNTPARCNTLKLQETTVTQMRRVARTAGHFGVFSPCGVVRCMELY